jgi:hypothetical protein
MRSTSGSLIAIWTLVAFIVVPDARAGVVLPDATFTQSTQGNGQVALHAAPTPSVHVGAAAGSFQAATATGTITYSFAVIGPANDISVPLNVKTFLSYEITGVAPASVYHLDALVTVDENPHVFQVASHIFTSSIFFVAFSENLSETLDYPARTGRVNKVTISALADLNNAQAAPANSLADALADPVISFAPNFDSTGFRIVFSGGIGNGTVVPAPSSLGMSLTMLGILGVMGAYRRLKRPALAASMRRRSLMQEFAR